jgi:hypothetical protein
VSRSAVERWITSAYQFNSKVNCAELATACAMITARLGNSSKTRQQIEDELGEALRLSQRAWNFAQEENRDAARQRFMKAIQAFNALVLDGKAPKE